jgi:hypothetical protein
LKIVSIDLSSNTGVAYFNTEQQDCLIDCFDFTLKHGTPMTLYKTSKLTDDQLARKRKVPRKRQLTKYDPREHPSDFLIYVEDYIDKLVNEIDSRHWFIGLDVMLLEQTNKGRDRWRQKLLEWLHHELCRRFSDKAPFKIKYIDTMTWRKILGIKVSRIDKKENKKIREYNKKAKISGETQIQGITKDKDVAIEFCKNTFNLSMKKKDHNIADTICIGFAYIKREGLIK